MEEKRLYFRMKNKGDITAFVSGKEIDVLEISSNGALVIKKSSKLPEVGVIEVHINNFSINITYKLLRVDKNAMVLVFVNEEEIDSLFVVLKRLRDERKRNSSH